MRSQSIQNKNAIIFDRFSKQNLIILVLFLVGYIIPISFVGFRTDHFWMIGVVSIALMAHEITHKFALGFIWYIIFWSLYDFMKLYPNYLANPVHVIEPYNFELAFFGIMHQGEKIILCEYFQFNHWTSLDIITGIFYLTWVPLPLAYSICLFFKNSYQLTYFGIAFLMCNLIGFSIYYLYPAAPPWYAILHGNEANINAVGDPAGLIRFDQYFGIELFQNIYSKNSNIYAAIPSLHSAYPVILMIVAFMNKHKWWGIVGIIDVLGIWFAAVYSMHHYVIDVLLGGLCAATTIVICHAIFKLKIVNSLMTKFSNYINLT